MHRAPPVQQWPRGPRNALHAAAEVGSEKLTIGLLSRISVDINQGDPKGCTPLFFAALNGHTRVVKMLLKHGANTAIAADGGITPLHASAQEGHVEVQRILVKAGANIEAETPSGATPLDIAAGKGRSKMIASLVESGANVNSRLRDRATPLFRAASRGHAGAVRELLLAKADPLLAKQEPWGGSSVPLDAAAQFGHIEVVRELVQQLGVKACGGATGGVDALHMAAGFDHVDVMAVLTGAGVVDTGVALVVAAEAGRESATKFLLQQREGETSSSSRNAAGTYVNNSRGANGKTPLVACIDFIKPTSPRIVRRLVDAGADTTSAVVMMNPQGMWCGISPLDRLSFLIRERKFGDGQDATAEQLLHFEAVRRSLLRVGAIRAVSWLWPPRRGDVTTTRAAKAAAASTSRTQTAPPTAETPFVLMWPVLRRRAERRGVVLAALFRYSGKRC